MTMTLDQAKEFVKKLSDSHPAGCSCGSDDCLSRETDGQDYERTLAEIVRDQTDWRSPRCAEKRQWCREHGIPCI
jgi:hypothetical protein